MIGYAGFVGLRPPGLIWTLVCVLPLSFYMVGGQKETKSVCLHER